MTKGEINFFEVILFTIYYFILPTTFLNRHFGDFLEMKKLMSYLGFPLCPFSSISLDQRLFETRETIAITASFYFGI